MKSSTDERAEKKAASSRKASSTDESKDESKEENSVTKSSIDECKDESSERHDSNDESSSMKTKVKAVVPRMQYRESSVPKAAQTKAENKEVPRKQHGPGQIRGRCARKVKTKAM